MEMVQESAYGNDYTNYFQLLKIEGKWLIVSKSYSATESVQQAAAKKEKMEMEAG